jgi:hypothetical protein
VPRVRGRPGTQVGDPGGVKLLFDLVGIFS